MEYEGDRTKEDIIEFIKKNKDSATQQESNQESASEQDSNKDEL